MISRFHHTIGGSNLDYFPATSSTAALTDFLSHDIGMFISYGLTSFTASDLYSTNYLIDPVAPTTFAAPSTVDSAQWATEAANLGCTYAVLTTGHHIGFNIFPYTAPYASGTTYDSNRGQLSVPVYSSYDVSQCPSSDQNIVGKFVNQCIVEGIKCGLYYNVGKNINIRRGTSKIDGSYDQTSTFSATYGAYAEYAIAEIEYICREFTPDYIWLDAAEFAPRYYNNNVEGRRYFQDFYNAVKRTSPQTLVVSNYDCPVIGGNRELLPNGTDVNNPPFDFDGTELVTFPLDVISFEALRLPTDNNDFLTPTIHEGTSYYIPKEIITTIFQDGTQYFAKDDNFGTMKLTSSLQSLYDNAQSLSVPFLLNVAVNKAGVIPSDQLTRFGTIVL